MVESRASHGLWDRDAEVGVIEDALARGCAGEGGLLVLRGPPGIGKSALLRVAGGLAAERGLLVLRARAAPFEREFPYGVVRQLFEPVLAGKDLSDKELFSGAAAGARHVLGEKPGTVAGQDASFASLHALYWLTANLASQAPVLACVDDVAWCDEPSLRFLEFLIRRLEGIRATVALAYRPGEPAAVERTGGLVLDARVLAPSPLSEAALAGMLAADLHDSEVDSEFCRACHEATGGNPLLVTELLRALEAEGVHPHAADVARVRQIGAVAVGPAVSRRLGSLGESAQALARAVAIFGQSVRRDDLAATVEMSAARLQSAIASLESAGIVSSEERVSFVHPLVAEAVGASLSAFERARLHERAAQALQQRGASAWELAPHVVAGALGAHPGAEGLLREAARWALDTGAPESAVTYLKRASAEVGPGENPAPLLLELGEAKLQAGDPSASDELERAVELAHDRRTRAMARIALWVALFSRGQYLRSVDFLDAGISEIAPEDPELAQRMTAHLLGSVLIAGPGIAQLPASVHNRLVSARSASYSHPTLADRMLLAELAYEEVVSGAPAAEVCALADQALAHDEILFAEGPASPPLIGAAAALFACDEAERVAAIWTAALAHARKLGTVSGFVVASAWRAAANGRLGRLLDAEADARAAREVGRHFVTGPAMINAGIALADALTAQGRLDEASTTLRQVAAPDPPDELTFSLLASHARVCLANQDYQAAASYLAHYDENARLIEWRKPAISGVGAIQHRSLWARALLGLGDLEGARALVEEERPLARAFGTHRAIGINLHTAGLLERGDARVKTLDHATEELGLSQSPLEYADALCDYGAALRRGNRRAEAREPLKAALTIAREAHARPLVDHVVQELRATGERVSRPDATGVDALTASERRIAWMAAAGDSNRDIAQALFITVKTVETHLSRVYRKLNLTGRGQLPAALGEGGTSAESVPDAQHVGTDKPVA